MVDSAVCEILVLTLREYLAVSGWVVWVLKGVLENSVCIVYFQIFTII